ncbi:ankyrin [Hymenopellis radicata]|nr:ankyrin [Hymenopellis radicata]
MERDLDAQSYRLAVLVLDFGIAKRDWICATQKQSVWYGRYTKERCARARQLALRIAYGSSLRGIEYFAWGHFKLQVNIFIAAQRGDVALIRELIESGKAKATDRDDQNITLAACRYLLEQGAEVDALGGDLVATPMQWASRNATYSHNADPTITDSQGYNALHLVTHSSSIMPLLYLLHQPINVDSRDLQGHTSLMWAAYQGDALSVDLLLRHGASPNTTDDAVRANRTIIRRLVERGADLTAKDGEGRTPREMATELKSLGAWKRALEEGGMNEYGVKKAKPFSDVPKHQNRNICTADHILYMIFMTLTILPWYTGILLALALFFGMHHIVTRVLLNNSTYTESVQQTPYFAGIIFASMVWVLYCWFTRLVQQTQSHAVAHLLFAVSVGLCIYNFFRAVMLDPGTCPKPASDNELKTIIEDLASEGRLNGQTFCIQCMARKPLRHCPWVWNCVGSNNHRQFVMFVATLVTGIIFFDYLTYQYISSSCPLPSDLCQMTSFDTFLVAVALWSTLQLSWTIVLLASQFWQIARQMTTLEVSNLGRYGFMGGRGGASMAGQMGHSHSRSGRRGFIMNLLGFDRFTKGKAVDGLARSSKASNLSISDVGKLQGLLDGGEGAWVEYDKLYDVPMEGFREAKRRRERDEEDDGRRRAVEEVYWVLLWRQEL